MQHRTIAAALAAVAVLALAGCSSDDKPALPGGIDAAKQSDKTPAAVPLGQPVTITGDDTIELTAIQVVDPAVTTGFSSELAPTERLIAVQWRIAAPGTTAVSEYPGMQSGVFDDQGQRYGADYTRKVTAGPSYPDGTSVNPGDSTLGYVAYIVPSTAKITKVQFPVGIGVPEATGTWTL